MALKKLLIKIVYLFLLVKILLVSSCVYALPIVLNLNGDVRTVDIMKIDGIWTDTIDSLDPEIPPSYIGERERNWTLTGQIVINDKVINPERDDYIRGRSGAFGVLSYDINFGDIFKLTNDRSTEAFWVGPDTSLYLGGYDFGSGYGQRIDSGSFLQNYSSGYRDINDPSTIKIDMGNGIYAAVIYSFMEVNSWSTISEVPEPSGLSLILVFILMLAIKYKRKHN